MFCINCGNEIDENSKFCIKCGGKISNLRSEKSRRFLSIKMLLIATGGLFASIAATFLYLSAKTSDQADRDIASAVVNIYCESGEEGGAMGGSGTIFSENGLVLTNAHIIPQDYQEAGKNCLVILPNPATGLPKEIYYADPIIVPSLSKEYDLAFMQISDVFYDQEGGRVYGEYPKEFPAYTGKRECAEEKVKLGEPIKVYGYPAISGGYALTITDGVVSSILQDEGLIITSAKISYGNSGGLAVDQNGCIIGVPSMITGDENESLGIIISTNLITEFAEQAKAYSKNQN